MDAAELVPATEDQAAAAGVQVTAPRPRPKRETTGVYLRGRIWWVSYCGPRRDGSWGEIFESSRSADKRDAEKLRERRIREARNHREGIRTFQGPARERLKVKDLLEALRSEYKKRPVKGLRQACVHLDRLTAMMGNERAVTIRKMRLDAYIAARREAKAADKTIDNELGLLKRAFNLARETDDFAFLPHFPKALVRGHVNARQGFVSREAFDRFLPELPSQVLRDLTLWAYATGMRRGEILSLSWDGYDRETQTLRLHAGAAKTGKARMISLAGWPEVAAIIERRLQDRRLGCSLVFHNGRGLRVGDFSTTWARAIARAKVPHFTFHDLRRTAVRNMIRAGVDRDVAKRISGHESDEIFSRYNITSEEDLAEAMRKRASYEAGLGRQLATDDAAILRSQDSSGKS